MIIENEDELHSALEMSYNKYVSYLKQKYGEAKVPYMTKNYNKNPKVTRTKEGLFCHHIMENRVSGLYDGDCAKKHPFSYQEPENLVYCNFLEHLILHLKITQEQIEEYMDKDIHYVYHPFPDTLGITGVNFIVSQLNDLYSGYVGTGWLQNCFNVVKDMEEDYYIIMNEVFKCVEIAIRNKMYPESYADALQTASYFKQYGWDNRKNERVVNNLVRCRELKLTPEDIERELRCIYGDEEIQAHGIKDCLALIDDHCCNICNCFDKCAIWGASWILQRYELVDSTIKE